MPNSQTVKVIASEILNIGFTPGLIPCDGNKERERGIEEVIKIKVKKKQKWIEDESQFEPESRSRRHFWPQR